MDEADDQPLDARSLVTMNARAPRFVRRDHALVRVPEIIAAITEHAVIATDAARVVTHFNRGAEKLLGYAADEVVGRNAPNGVPVGLTVAPPDRHGAEPSAWTFVHRNGRRIPVALAVDALHGDAGTVVGYVGVAQDLTGTPRAEAAVVAHVTEQEALLGVAKLVATGADPAAVFSATAEHAARALDGISSAVFRLEPTGDARMVGCWSRSDMPRLTVGDLLDLSAPTATARAFRTRIAQSAHYLTERAGLINGPPLPLRSGAAALIEVGGRPWGAVSVGWGDASAADPGALPRVSRFAALVGLAVTSAGI